MKKITIYLLILCSSIFSQVNRSEKQKPLVEFNPRVYQCLKTTEEIRIDGIDDEKIWKETAWTESFIDIEGPSKPLPYFDTKVKMCWDDGYIYFFARMEEPHIWAKLTEHDAVIYKDNDFEIFIDPDGDTFNYYEYEINALGTDWDLFLRKPYRDGHKVAINSWEIPGKKVAVHVEGTVNNPGDKDQFWTVEIAIPFKVLSEVAFNLEKAARVGDYWRVNFSRVQWKTEVKEGKYVKLKDKMGRDLPEHNWVWSPQGIIAMHYPEMWGFVYFAKDKKDQFEIPEIEFAKWELRKIYYEQSSYYKKHKTYTSDLNSLNIQPKEFKNFKFEGIETIKNYYEAKYVSRKGKKIIISSSGKTWIE